MKGLQMCGLRSVLLVPLEVGNNPSNVIIVESGDTTVISIKPL